MQAHKSSREIIFDVLLELFASEGYSVVSMRQIAKASGIAVASIYNHFSSKQDILYEIYRFFDSTLESLCPNLEELLAMVPHQPPREVLRKTTVLYPKEVLQRMTLATAVVMSLVQHDSEADALLNKFLLELPSHYDIPLLNRMMELDLIEPIDPERFAMLHANCHLGAAVRHFTNHPVTDEKWLGSLDLLFELVQEKNQT